MHEVDHAGVLPVDVAEIEELLHAAVKLMKNNNACADDCVVAEMLKTGHAELLRTIAELFSELLSGTRRPPVEWKIPHSSFQKRRPFTAK